MNGVTASERTCAACGRGFTGKAGRMLAGRPVCPSCAAGLRDPVPCAACGRMTRRPGRAPGHEGLVCEPCQRRGTHTTCRVCSRHRRIAEVGDDGRAVCAGCAGDVPATHPCPDCGAATPGRGAAPCRACDLRRRIERRVAVSAELLDRPWVRALFEAFCAWEGLPRTATTLPRRIDAYARCFAAIGEGCTGPGEVGQERLLALLGAEGLRRNHLVIRFLIGRLSLDWDPALSEAHTEGRRVEAVLAASDGRPWGPALRAYRDHLALDGALRPKTVRFYMNAAAGLLGRAACADLAFLQQAEVDRYLHRRPGQRASLTRFLAYAAHTAGVRLALPRRGPRARPEAREKALLRGVRGLLDRLGRAGSAAEGRAILAMAISKVHAVPLSAVLALKASDAAGGGGTVLTLWPDGPALDLAPALAGHLRRWAAWDGGYLFPGRNGAQPLSCAAVRYHAPAEKSRLRRRAARGTRSHDGC